MEGGHLSVSYWLHKTQLESLSFSMSANIPPLLQFFRTSALVSVLIYEKEHTQKQQFGTLELPKNTDMRKMRTKHSIDEVNRRGSGGIWTKQKISLLLTVYITWVSTHEEFFIHLMCIWQNRYACILINIAIYTDHVTVCISSAPFVCNETQGIFFMLQVYFFAFYAHNYSDTTTVVYGALSTAKTQVTSSQYCAWMHPVQTQVEDWSYCSSSA